MKKKILIVDDAAINRELLTNMFDSVYDVLEAENGKEALLKLEANQNEILIILLDLHMPVMNGFELLNELKEKRILEHIPVILITGDDSTLSERTGYEFGISELIKKPFDPYLVFMRVKNIIDLYRHKNHLEELVLEQTGKIQTQAKTLKAFNRHLIDTLSTIVEFRNLESGQHIKRIRVIVKALLESINRYYPEYELDEEKIEMIAMASAMHDVGKIAIPDSILLKPGRLTPEEFEVMKSHSVKGCEIINIVSHGQEDEEFYQYCYDIARHHHERYDGHGYPDGLVGDNISIAAQAVSVADVYDALVSDRIYKSAFSKDKAFQMIVNGECGVFGPKVMECFRYVRTELERLVEENSDVLNN